MSSHNNENESGYNAWSEFYDSYPNPTVALDDLTFPQVYAEVHRQNVLEIGCGTGRHTLRLLAAENKVTGIDISEGMLARLRTKAGNPSLHLIHGDFLSENLPNGPFDSILASLVLEHIPELDRFFSTSQKALKRNGRLYLSEIHPDRTSNGIFAHFKKPDGSEVHLKSLPHTFSAVSAAATSNGFKMKSNLTIKGNQELTDLNGSGGLKRDQSWREVSPMVQRFLSGFEGPVFFKI